MSGVFTVVFYNDAAAKEYRKLDGSMKRLVNVALLKLQTRADEIGTPLSGPLAGCKKIKWRNVGLRMIFRIVDETTVEIVEVIAIGQRDKERAYRTATQRIETPAHRTGMFTPLDDTSC